MGHRGVAVAFAAAVALSGARARAEEPADPAAACKALVGEMARAREKADDAALAAALGKAGAVYKSVKDPALQEAVRREIGASLKNAKMPLSRQAALPALVATGDSEHAWRALSPVFPPAETLIAEPWDVAVVDAAGTLHPEGAIQPLLLLFEKAKDPKLSAAAVNALGSYRGSRQRVRILVSVVEEGKKMVPPTGRRRPDPAVNDRWQAVSPAIASALDRLTGQAIGDARQWFQRVDDTKDPKSLFRD
jgi:hypothetical protein